MLTNPSEMRALGPLGTFAAGFADELARQGYTPHSARFQMRLMAQLSRWLVDEGLDAGDLRTTGVERSLLARPAARGGTVSTCRSCRRLHEPSLDQSDAGHPRLPARRGGGANTAAARAQRSGGRGAGTIPALPGG